MLKSPEQPDSLSFLEFLGVSAHPLKIENFIDLMSRNNIQDYKGHHINQKQVWKDLEFIERQFPRDDFNSDGLVIIKEMWDFIECCT